MAEPDLEPLRRWLRQSTGLEADRLGTARLERAVRQRWPQSACRSAAHYLERLPADPQEQQQLLEQLLVGESWFLREPRSFVQLQEWAAAQTQRPLRLLSCGCASGEEPYSLLIALLEAGLTLQQLQVEAIDLSAAALGRAAEGVYGAHALRSLEHARKARHFQPLQPEPATVQVARSQWRLRPDLRAAVRFHHGTVLNQLQRLPAGWHAVFCRHLLIYLDAAAQRQLLDAIAERLAPGGLLVVGAAEALLVPTQRFRPQGGGHGAAFAPIQTEAETEPRAAQQLHAARRLQEQGRREEALAAARRCLYLDPRRQDALELAADLAQQLGRREEAERQRRRLERRQVRRQP